jgi:putative transposase
MARKIRIEFPGAFYHVLDRGDRREAIYGDDDNLAGSGLESLKLKI